MCGLSGYFAFANPPGDTSSLWAMNRAVAHRGPDGEGACFIDTRSGQATHVAGERTPLVPADLPSASAFSSVAHDLAFGHRRFVLVDMTPGGHQPLAVADGRLILSFQGEIYNHEELRAELARAGHVFRSRSDAEVLAHAWLEWGEACLDRLRGFWALALWDGRPEVAGQGQGMGVDGAGGRTGSRGTHGTLWLARDPLGKAPLYIARAAGRLWWSSEIKGLRAGAGRAAFPPRAVAVREFVGAGLRDFEDKTFYEGVESFPAGSVARVRADGSFAPRRYWAPPRERLRASDLGADEAVAGLRARLADAVNLRLRADVPVGVELSGGMDSSAIAALAAIARDPARPLAAYTVAFPGTAWDESPFARRVAEHLGDRVTLTTLDHDADESSASVASLRLFHREMDEPIHSPVLALNRSILQRMAAAGLRATLNGAGGDEVLAGYGHEYFGPYLRDLVAHGRLARAVREAGSFSEREARAVRAWARTAWWMVPESWRKRLKSPRPPAALDPMRGDTPPLFASGDFAQRLLDHLGGYKMNYWLRSGNTATMSVPIEARLPLLDVRVVEWAAQLPGEYLIRDGWLKWVLRRAVDADLPHDVTWRKVKMGFPFPLAEWLRAARPGLEAHRTPRDGDPPHIDRARLFASYDALAVSHPVYLWRCLSVLLWWDECVAAS